MNFFKRLKPWSWLSVIVLSAIVVADNILKGSDLWISVIIAAGTIVGAIYTERQYQYDLPVNHPDQDSDEQDILGNLIGAIIATFMCVAPIAYGSNWTPSFGIITGLLGFYAVWKSANLYYTTKGHVKYVG